MDEQLRKIQYSLNDEECKVYKEIKNNFKKRRIDSTHQGAEIIRNEIKTIKKRRKEMNRAFSDTSNVIHTASRFKSFLFT